MRDAVIAGAVRTPIGKRGGAYRDVHPTELSQHVLRALASQTLVDPSDIDDVIWGVVEKVGEQSMNAARNAVLAAGWPEHVPGTTVDRQCGSSQQAIHFAAAGVIAGHYDMVVAGGAESMTRVPMGSAYGESPMAPYGPSIEARYPGWDFHQGKGAELIARRRALSRERLDEFAFRSHELAARASDSGALSGQLAPLPGALLDHDEGIRRDTSLEKLAALPPAFVEGGVLHAGNSSQISDGAAAILVTTSRLAMDRGLPVLARIKTCVAVGSDPIEMLSGPIPATERALQRAGLTIDDIGAYEVNEAFACVPLAWLDALGARPERLNPLGGAIATGHPLGASGAILMTRLVHHMNAHDIRYGLQAICEGGGTANACILERA